MPSALNCFAKASGDTMIRVRTAGRFSDDASAVRAETHPLNL